MSAQSWQELLPRHEAFLTCTSVDRPLLGAWVGGYYPADQFPRGHATWRSRQVLTPADVRCPLFREDYEQLYDSHRAADDDFFYVGSAYWGIPWLEAILGCAIVAGTNNCWAEPWLQHPQDIVRVCPDLDKNAWFHCLVEFSTELVELADDRFPVCPPLLRGPGDAACAVCGSERVLLSVVDGELWVREVLQRCAEVRVQVLQRLQEILPAWRGTHAAGGYPSKVWSSQTVSYYQDDAASLLNPRLYRGLLLPLARSTKPSADVRFIHLHSACLYMLDALLADDTFSVIEINLDLPESNKGLADYLPLLKRVQQAGRPLLLWGDVNPQDWDTLRSELQPSGLSIQPMVKQPQDMSRFGWR